MSLVYLNGKFLPLREAHISPLDRGFLFGDGIYEVIPFYNGKAMGLDEHLARLQRSLEAVEIKRTLYNSEWKALFTRLLSEQTSPAVAIYLQITRGATDKRTHFFPDPEVPPTIFAYATPFNADEYNNGLAAITIEDIRWCDCYIKSLNLLPNCLAREVAQRHGAQEALLYRDDLVTEGSSSNVFIVKNGCVITPPLSVHMLPGVTRTLILQILNEQKISYVETALSLDTLHDADEIWISSSIREVAPVIKLDDKIIGNGKPGVITQQVMQQYKLKARS
jgi:D-alanine transaminase